MKVYISGMSSTGKSTLINYIKEHQDIFEALLELKSYQRQIKFNETTYIEEVARKFFEDNNRGYATYEELLKNYGDCMEYWGELIDHYREIDRKCCARNCIYIIDRGPIDYKINLTLNYTAGSAKQMKEYAMQYHDYYDKICGVGYDDLVFMTNPYKVDLDSVESDGFRPSGLIYRRVLEQSLFDLAVRQNDNIIMLPNDTDQRFAKVVYGIKAKLDEQFNRRDL